MIKHSDTRSQPSVVSLFTGAGGLDIGLEMAGFHTVAAVDNEADCIATLAATQKKRVRVPRGAGRYFLQGTNLIHGRVQDLTATDLRPTGAAESWSPDLLAGGPPCQPFSSAGKQKGFDDPRGRLFEDFVRLAEGLQPKIVLMV